MSSFKIQADGGQLAYLDRLIAIALISFGEKVASLVRDPFNLPYLCKHNMCYLLLRLKLIIIFFLPYTPITHSVGRSSSRLVATSWHTFHVNVTPL